MILLVKFFYSISKWLLHNIILLIHHYLLHLFLSCVITWFTNVCAKIWAGYKLFSADYTTAIIVLRIISRGRDRCTLRPNMQRWDAHLHNSPYFHQSNLNPIADVDIVAKFVDINNNLSEVDSIWSGFLFFFLGAAKYRPKQYAW